MWYVEDNYLKSDAGTRDYGYVPTAARFIESLLLLLGRHSLISYYWRNNPAEMVVIFDGFTVKYGVSKDTYQILEVMLEDYRGH